MNPSNMQVTANLPERNTLPVGILSMANPLGPLIIPYACIRENDNYITLSERLTSATNTKYEQFTEEESEFIRLCESYSDHEIIRQFSRKKLTTREFYQQLDKKLLEEQIRPFIEKRLAQILRLIVSGTVRLYDGKSNPNLFPNDEILPDKEPLTTRFRFTRNSEGTEYQLEVFRKNQVLDLKAKGNLVLVKEPCYLIHDNRLMQLPEEIHGRVLTPFMNKDKITIPTRIETHYFNTFIKKLVQRSDIEAEGFEVKDLQLLPVPVLELEISWTGKPAMVLGFEYGEKKVFLNDTQKTFIRLITDDHGFTFYRLKRKPAQENQYVRILTDLGFRKNESLFNFPGQEDADDSLNTFIQKIARLREQLESHGFTIRQKLQKMYHLGIPELVTEVKSRNDWFDLQAEVHVQGFTIPFALFRDHIIQNNHEYLLPNGEVLVLPDEWFSRYRQLMLFAVHNRKTISLHKHHFPLLESFQTGEAEELQQSLASTSNFSVPELAGISLRSYQLAGYFWMKNLAKQGFGGILADDMGLGKTIQMIAILAGFHPVKEFIPFPGPGKRRSEFQLDLFSPEPGHEDRVQESAHLVPASLVVMPSSLVHNWLNELQRLAPHLRILCYTGLNRQISEAITLQYDVIITTYGILRNDIGQFHNLTFSYLILDESQNIKNPSSKTALAAFSLKGCHRVTLTGTPVENSLSDLWSQMHFANPGLLGSQQVFMKMVDPASLEEKDHPAGLRLRKLLQPFILRRTKQDVTPELPPLAENVVYCGMSEEQQQVYESEKSKMRNLLLEKIGDLGVRQSGIWVLKALMKLRQLANHPELADPGCGLESGKFGNITEMLETILEEGHKVLVFSSFIRHLGLLEQYCRDHGHDYSLLTGSTIKREKVIQRFRKSKSASVFLISLKAGGVGLNLVEADYVFVIDPWWNPAAELQAINRAHRIGQDKSVFVYRFITRESVEEKILSLQSRKKDLADLVIRPSAMFADMSSAEILSLFN